MALWYTHRAPMRQWILTETGGLSAKLFPLVISWMVLSSSWKAGDHVGRPFKTPASSSGSFFLFASRKLFEVSEFQEAAGQTLTSLLCPKQPLQPQVPSDSTVRTQFNWFPVTLEGEFAKPTSFKTELRILLSKDVVSQQQWEMNRIFTTVLSGRKHTGLLHRKSCSHS